MFVKKNALCRELRIAGQMPSEVMKQMADKLAAAEGEQANAAKQIRQLENQARTQTTTIVQLQHSLDTLREATKDSQNTITQLVAQNELANLTISQLKTYVFYCACSYRNLCSLYL